MAGSSLVLAIGTTIWLLWWVVRAMGELPRPSVRLENKSDEQVAVERQPAESKIELTLIRPGDHAYLPVERADVTDVEVCLVANPGSLVRLADGPPTDPAPSIPEVLAVLPGGRCYEGRDVRLEWSGVEFSVRRDQGIDGDVLFLGVVAGLSLVILTGGIVIDVATHRRN